MPAHRICDKRVKAYRAMGLLCFCIVLSHFAFAMNELHIQRRKRYKILWQRRDRKRQRLLARKARIQKKMDICAAKIAQYEERIRVKEIQLRKHATAHAGMVAGFSATVPLDSAQLQELHFSRRYREAYLEATSQKQQWLAAMQKQNNPTPVVQPSTIKLS